MKSNTFKEVGNSFFNPFCAQVLIRGTEGAVDQLQVHQEGMDHLQVVIITGGEVLEHLPDTITEEEEGAMEQEELQQVVEVPKLWVQVFSLTFIHSNIHAVQSVLEE